MTDTNESMREFTRTINSIQTKDAAPLKKQSLAKRLMQLLGPLKTHPPAKVSEDAKTPYVPTVDYINNPKMKYTPPSVLRRLAAIKKRQAKEASVKEEVLSIDEARIRVIKARIRGGKIQRRKKVSNVKGYTIRGGKLTRMSSKEKLDRKRGARVGKVKRRAQMARALVKRKRSLRKRTALGL